MNARLNQTGEGAGWGRNAISRMDQMTGATKIRKKTVWSDWRGQISIQKIVVETSKNNHSIKIDREITEGNNFCWKNWGHPWICRSLHMKISEVISDIECVQIHVKIIAIQEKKSLRNAHANHLFQSISGLRLGFPMQCSGISICRMDKHVAQNDGRKSGAGGRIPRKDSKRMSTPAAWKEFSWFWILLPDDRPVYI